jgi:hypothetical protein
MTLALLKDMKKWKVIIQLTSILLLLNLYSLCFAENRAAIMVSATVKARVSQAIIHQESTIQITEMDIKRGFIEIPSGTILQVKTNDRNGYVLFFEGEYEFFEEVMVMDKGRTIALSHNGGFVHQPYSGNNIEVKDLSYKLQLKENIQPGSYPFPFRVKASLL